MRALYKGIGGVAIAIRPAYTNRCEAKKLLLQEALLGLLGVLYIIYIYIYCYIGVIHRII